MDVPEDLRYSDDHEWLRLDGEQGVVGITAYAADQLGDVVFVELPASGTALAPRQTFGVVESVKAASDIYSPLDGEVVERNDAAIDGPEVLNSSPYDDAWLIKVKLADPSQVDALMDPSSYRSYADNASH